jgi:outer membrane protein
MKRCLLLAAILGVCPHVASADVDPDDQGEREGEATSALPIKLSELITYAVRSSPALAKARIDRTIAIGAAGATRSEQAWVVTAKAAIARSAVADRVEVDPMATVATDKMNADVTVDHKFENGATIRLEVSLEHTNTEYNVTAINQFLGTVGSAASMTGSGSDQTQYEYQDGNTFTTKVTYNQPLLRGLGSDVTLAKEHKAELDVLVSTVKGQQAAEEAIGDLINSYWELAYTSYEVDIRAESLDLAKKQGVLAHEEKLAGITSGTASNSVAYEIAVRKEALVRAQTDLENKSLDLRRKAGLELSQRDILLRPSEEFEIGNDAVDTKEAIARSRKWNRKAAVIALEAKAADIDVKVSENAMLPQFDIGVSGALIGYGGGPDGAPGTTGVGDALGGLSSGFEVMGNATVSFEIAGGAKSGHQAALAKRHKLDVERADLERTTDTQVVAAVHAIANAKERVDMTDESVLVSDQNLRAEHAVFMSGKGDSNKILQGQTRLIEARLRRGRAVADYHIAVMKLRTLNGTLLAQYQIDVRPPQSN